jgi:hypothetical protein
LSLDNVCRYVARASWPSSNGKVYQTVYLRHSCRQGSQVKTRNIANLTHCPEEEIAAMELALKHKGNLAVLGSLAQVRLREGPSVGAVWTLATIARRLGLEQALGRDFPGQLALWQVLARVLDQGSRLSAVRLAPVHAACDVLGIRRGFDENDLHQNLTWLSQRQEAIERRLFALRRGRQKPELFLYDVTSSCLEGVANELADYGYGRDGKKGKKQIVIGLLCDEQGEPVSTEVFRGHTRDRQTFASQVDKAADWFGCERVTFVGDRGMIKRAQRKDLREVGCPYLTAITKPEVEALTDDEEVSKEGRKFFIDMTYTRASSSEAYLGLDFGTSNSAVSFINRSWVQLTDVRVGHSKWREVGELVDLLPFSLATPLARYIGQFGDHVATPPEFSFLEAALTLMAYVAFCEYCALQQPGTRLFKDLRQRSAGPLWQFLRNTTKHLGRRASVCAPFEALCQGRNAQLIEAMVDTWAQVKHEKTPGRSLDVLGTIRVIANVCHEAFSQYKFGYFEAVQKKLVGKYKGRFQVAHGCPPFSTFYLYTGAEV